jgi:hypothetical protein
VANFCVPNNDHPGNRANNGYLPLTREADPVHPSNTPSDRRSGTMPMSGTMGEVKPPNHKFAVGMSGQPPAAPMGTAAIPVQPGHGGPVGDGGGSPSNGLEAARADYASMLRSPKMPR